MKVLSIHYLFLLLTIMGIPTTDTGSTQGRGDDNLSDNSLSNRPSVADNPLLAEWTGEYGGVPPFDKVKVAYFEPALEAGMKEHLEEIDRIASSQEVPTFENTIAAFERSGKMIERVQRIYGIWSGNMSSPDFQAVQREMAPRLAAFSDKIIQNEKLFKKIESIYNSPEKSRLTPEQQRLVWLHYTNLARSGAKLDKKQKERLSVINQRLAGLFTKFSQNVLADESEKMLVLEHANDLAGLPFSVKNAAAEQAREKNLPDKWVIANTRSSVDPFLTYSGKRALREKVWKMFINRGDNGDRNDNNSTITDILKLRSERATLLGYPTHAHWRLENTMAKTPEKALALLEEVWKPAVARVSEEVADMQSFAIKDGAKITIAPWDYRYYAEKVRKERYDLDQNEVKPYLQLDKLRDGMFWVAGELFNFSFSPVTNVSVYHPDVKVWEVKDKNSGTHVGLWYFDPYAREGKRSGAWMNAYRVQEEMDRPVTTIVSNNSNFVKGKPGEPVLISWDDATTLFHEFGHALHGLSSKVTYPSLSGTAVVRDYVEFPSQLLEHWLSTPEVLQRFALHYKTGEPIPQQLVDRIEKASKFNQGFATTEYLASALMDMKYHLSTAEEIDPDKFERETLSSLGMPKELVMRHRSPHFSHIFSSDSYSAGYYSYLWSDVLTADAYNAFTEAGGPYDKAVAEKLRLNIFSVGNTIDPEVGYKNFRGRDPQIEPLMKKRGFSADVEK
ncbi:MAG TPA: M3 family metallopeptidase [Chryseosolibacter sp.]